MSLHSLLAFSLLLTLHTPYLCRCTPITSPLVVVKSAHLVGDNPRRCRRANQEADVLLRLWIDVCLEFVIQHPESAIDRSLFVLPYPSPLPCIFGLLSLDPPRSLLFVSISTSFFVSPTPLHPATAACCQEKDARHPACSKPIRHRPVFPCCSAAGYRAHYLASPVSMFRNRSAFVTCSMAPQLLFPGLFCFRAHALWPNEVFRSSIDLALCTLAWPSASLISLRPAAPFPLGPGLLFCPDTSTSSYLTK